MADKILVDESTLEDAAKMLDKLHHHYKLKARKVEIARRPGWKENEAKYEIKAAEVAIIVGEIYEALEA